MQSGRVKSEIYECKVHNGSRVYVMCVCVGVSASPNGNQLAPTSDRIRSSSNRVWRATGLAHSTPYEAGCFLNTFHH